MPQNDDRKEVDLLDVLKDRVEAGKPIYIIGARGSGVAQNVEVLRKNLASDASKPVRVIEVVDLPEIPGAAKP